MRSTVSYRGLAVAPDTILRKVPRGTPIWSATSSITGRPASRSSERSRKRMSVLMNGAPDCGTVYGPCQAPFSVPPCGYAGTVSSRRIVKENLGRLIAAKKAAEPLKTWRHDDIARRAGVGKGSIGRMVRGEAGTRVDTLDAVANVFGIPAWALLVPNLRADEEPVYTTAEKQQAMVAAVKLLVEASETGYEKAAGSAAVSPARDRAHPGREPTLVPGQQGKK